MAVSHTYMIRMTAKYLYDPPSCKDKSRKKFWTIVFFCHSQDFLEKYIFVMIVFISYCDKYKTLS